MRLIDKALKTRNKPVQKILNRLLHKPLFEAFFQNEANRLDEPLLTFSFDTDFKEDIKALPVLLEKLKSFDIKADFACIGVYMKRYAKQHKIIIDEGHEIINHTYSHPWNDQTNPKERLDRLKFAQRKSELMKFHQISKDLFEYEPIGFRMPHFTVMPPESMYRILRDCGYRYSSSKFALDTPNAGLPYKVSGIIEIPVSPCPKHPFGTLDSWHSLHLENMLLRRNHRTEFLSLFKQLLRKGLERKTYINLYFDPMDTAHNKQFEGILEYAHKSKVKILTYEELLNRKDIIQRLK